MSAPAVHDAAATRRSSRIRQALRRLRGLGEAAFNAIPLAFAILAISIPVLLLPVTPEQAEIEPGLYPLALTMVALSAVRLAFLIAEDRPKIVAGTFWMFLYIAVGVVPLAQLNTQSFGFFLVEHGYMTAAEVIFLVAAIAFEVGHRLGRVSEAAADAPRRASRVLTRPRLVGLSIFATLATIVYVRGIGGPAVFFQSRSALTAAYESSGLRSESSQVLSGLLSSASAGPSLVALIGWLIVIRVRKDRRPTDFLWLGWVLALNIVVNNPLISARYWALTVLVGLAYALPGMGRRRFTWVIIFGILGALVVFPYTDVTRYSSLGEGTAVEVESVADKIATKDYDQVVMTANGVNYIEKEGFALGHQTGSALLFWVPRSMWPDKGKDTGVLLGDYFDLYISNLSSPLPVEVWIDFGWLGMGLAFVAFGYGSRRMEDRLRFDGPIGFGHTTLPALLLPLLAGYGFILMRGPLLQSMSRLAAMVAACILVTAIVREGGDDARGRTRRRVTLRDGRVLTVKTKVPLARGNARNTLTGRASRNGGNDDAD
ncbi:hypothetical protein [Demequina maris]|uniref:hypothetical protein n=1 Tax=Demequina maris TaxID=1638982 RepID=UPI000781371E|nr:hypothetical protein [Demequina maris]